MRAEIIADLNILFFYTLRVGVESRRFIVNVDCLRGGILIDEENFT